MLARIKQVQPTPSHSVAETTPNDGTDFSIYKGMIIEVEKVWKNPNFWLCSGELFRVVDGRITTHLLDFAHLCEHQLSFDILEEEQEVVTGVENVTVRTSSTEVPVPEIG